VLVANASRARLFERDPDNGALRELWSFVHPDSRVKGVELAHDRPGHAMKSQARTQYQPHTSPEDRELDRFAHELAEVLEAAALDNSLARWALIASNPLLGRLRAVLRNGAAARLEHHEERDLTIYVGADLEHRVTSILAPDATESPR
jgi:protein required for attachment to host cells